MTFVASLRATSDTIPSINNQSLGLASKRRFQLGYITRTKAMVSLFFDFFLEILILLPVSVSMVQQSVITLSRCEESFFEPAKDLMKAAAKADNCVFLASVKV